MDEFPRFLRWESVHLSETYGDSVMVKDRLPASQELVYADLATPGPTVANVVVRSGWCVVELRTWVYRPDEDSPSDDEEDPGSDIMRYAFMGFDILGATQRKAQPDMSLCVIFSRNQKGVATEVRSRFLVRGLNPGRHMFIAKYANMGPEGDVGFHHRRLTVVAY